jgi:hypothetical protein
MRLAAGPLLAAVLIALAVPAAADAATRSYKGSFKVSGKTTGIARFEMRTNDRGIRKIAHWRWRNLPLVCANGPQRHDGYFEPPPILVDETQEGRTFSKRAEDQMNPENFAEVHGSFPGSWKRATGTFQVAGDTGVGDDCQSGVVSWSANRLPRATI